MLQWPGKYSKGLRLSRNRHDGRLGAGRPLLTMSEQTEGSEQGATIPKMAFVDGAGAHSVDAFRRQSHIQFGHVGHGFVCGQISAPAMGLDGARGRGGRGCGVTRAQPRPASEY